MFLWLQSRTGQLFWYPFKTSDNGNKRGASLLPSASLLENGVPLWVGGGFFVLVFLQASAIMKGRLRHCGHKHTQPASRTMEAAHSDFASFNNKMCTWGAGTIGDHSGSPFSRSAWLGVCVFEKWALSWRGSQSCELLWTHFSTWLLTG